MRARGGNGKRDGKRGGSLMPCLLLVMAAMAMLALTACGRDSGESGVRVVVTYAPPTATPPPRALTQPAALPTVTAVAFSTGVPTITNIGSSQLAMGAKAKVKDSADGLNLRDTPSRNGKVLTSLAAGTVVSVLADPTDAEGRQWVKVSYNGFQGYVAAEFMERTA